MTGKKETKGIKLPKVELKEGNITITGDELNLGVKEKDKGFDKDTNMNIKNPVIAIPYNKEVIEDIASILLMLVDVTNAKQGGLAGPESIKKVFKEYREAYRGYKKEDAENNIE